jgi:integrase
LRIRELAKVRPWTPQVYGAFLDYLDGTRDRMGVLLHVAGHTGLRRGELCGLRWEDVDPAQRVLVVRRQIVEFGSRVVVSKLKTRSGEDRVVDLDAGTVFVLRVWRAPQEQQRNQADTRTRGMCSPDPIDTTGTRHM